MSCTVVKKILLCLLALAIGSYIFIAHPQNTFAAFGDGPWRTSGARIFDREGNEVIMTGTTWALNTSQHPEGKVTFWGIYNGKSPNFREIIRAMRRAGFNTIRFSISPWHFNSDCTFQIGGNNSELTGLSCLQVVDKVVEEAGNNGMKVILLVGMGASSRNPISDPSLVTNWKTLAQRYKNNSTVVGADLFNEPVGVCWGCSDSKRDWRRFAQNLGNQILTVNPNWLIIVEGIDKGYSLASVSQYPIKLSVPNKLVYSVHHYFDHGTTANNVWASNIENRWGFVLKQNIAPVYVGEFGIYTPNNTQIRWYNFLIDYIKTNHAQSAECCWSYNSPTQAHEKWYIFTMINNDYLTMYDDARTSSRSQWFSRAFGSPTQPPPPPPSSTLPDANSDGAVNFSDFLILKTNFGPTGGGVSKGDFNTDGVVDGLDYSLWFENCQTNCTGS